MSPPLIALENVSRSFKAGDQTVTALDSVSLTLAAGEMVATVGTSGSGKSTLMNLLGCLDRPTSGTYRFAGRAVSSLSPEELARLRREHFGFVFQRYHLLADLTAAGNVEIPAIYAGLAGSSRRRRAAALLERLGLTGRSDHRPGELSGGQQQRVSIARALMNGGEVILADEPTGALDSHSGEEVLKILQGLHRDGRTVILVTHDRDVARHAGRIIEIADGRIVSDRRQTPVDAAVPAEADTTRVSHANAAEGASAGAGAGAGAVNDPSSRSRRASRFAGWGRFSEAMHMALLAMAAHRLRTFLTMLGISIGVASVVAVVAVGEGSRRQVLAGINNLGTNTIEIWAGRGWGDPNEQKRVGLRPQDAEALANEPYLAGASPVVELALTVRRGNVSATASVTGVNDQYFRIMGLRMAEGSAFDGRAVERRAQDVVIDRAARRTLFGAGEDPLGKVIMLGSVPVRVIGVVAPSATLDRWPGGKNVRVLAPYTTVTDRIGGKARLDSISVRVRDEVSPAAAEHALTRLLTLRRGNSDISLVNADGIRKVVEATSATLTLLISIIAAISLFVGGIGVMNIMLVSVSERTREIGVRMAIGARRGDILQQFLIEAVLVCLIGGLIGIGLALGAGWLLRVLSAPWQMIYSINSIIAAFVTSLLVGVVFGYLPARNAARLDPVVALARE